MEHYHVFQFVDSFFHSSKQNIKVHYFITKPHKQLQYKPISGSHQLNKQKWKSQFIINCINLQYSFEEKKLRLVRDTINSKQHKLKDFWKCLIQIREKYTKNTASQNIILNVLDPLRPFGESHSTMAPTDYKLDTCILGHLSLVFSIYNLISRCVFCHMSYPLIFLSLKIQL